MINSQSNITGVKRNEIQRHVVQTQKNSVVIVKRTKVLDVNAETVKELETMKELETVKELEIKDEKSNDLEIKK
jgi:hypothetical protein